MQQEVAMLYNHVRHSSQQHGLQSSGQNSNRASLGPGHDWDKQQRLPPSIYMSSEKKSMRLPS